MSSVTDNFDEISHEQGFLGCNFCLIIYKSLNVGWNGAVKWKHFN